MKKDVARLAGEIVSLAHQQNAKDYTVFVNYSGHIPGAELDVRIHKGGWESYRDASDSRSFFSSKPSALKETIRWMKRIHKEYRNA